MVVQMQAPVWDAVVFFVAVSSFNSKLDVFRRGGLPTNKLLSHGRGVFLLCTVESPSGSSWIPANVRCQLLRSLQDADGTLQVVFPLSGTWLEFDVLSCRQAVSGTLKTQSMGISFFVGS